MKEKGISSTILIALVIIVAVVGGTAVYTFTKLTGEEGAVIKIENFTTWDGFLANSWDEFSITYSNVGDSSVRVAEVYVGEKYFPVAREVRLIEPGETKTLSASYSTKSMGGLMAGQDIYIELLDKGRNVLASYTAEEGTYYIENM